MRRLIATTAAALVLASSAIAAEVASAPVALAASPGWITTCPQSAPDHVADPIGGAMHVHRFVGAHELLDTSTPATMRASGTSCLTRGDSSGSWVPQVLEDGQPVATGPKGTLFYYRRKGAPAGVQVQPVPDGLKFLVGNAHATSQADNPAIGAGHITWKCGPGSGTETPAPPAQCSSGVLVAVFILPNCGTGALDSADHMSHLAYPVGSSCPASHPVVFPRIQAFWRFQVGTDPINLSLASGPYYTMHMDYLNAWDQAALQSLIARCINGMVDCGTDPAP